MIKLNSDGHVPRLICFMKKKEKLLVHLLIDQDYAIPSRQGNGQLSGLILEKTYKSLFRQIRMKSLTEYHLVILRRSLSIRSRKRNYHFI